MDDPLRNEIALRYQNLIWQSVRKFARKGVLRGPEIDDGFQEGMVAVLRALKYIKPGAGGLTTKLKKHINTRIFYFALCRNRIVCMPFKPRRNYEHVRQKKVYSTTDELVLLDLHCQGKQEEALDLKEIVALADELPEPERTLIRERYGFDGDIYSLRELAAKYAVSHQTVRDWEKGALKQLRGGLGI